MLNRIKAADPYGRLGEPEDTSGAVDLIAGSGKWLNGAKIRANGGSFA
jgi:NAD(P)-dependent dehydrogenase (short-subunit alcohol dehydrogenase family)